MSVRACRSSSVAGRMVWGSGGNCNTEQTKGPLPPPALDPGSGRNHPVFWNDDDPVADEVAVAIGMLHASRVDQLRTVADARVLVHDHLVEDDVAADAEPRGPAARGRALVGLVEVGAEEHRPPDGRAGLDVGANADHRLLDRGAIDVAPLGDDRVARGAVAEARAGQEARVRVNR